VRHVHLFRDNIPQPGKCIGRGGMERLTSWSQLLALVLLLEGHLLLDHGRDMRCPESQVAELFAVQRSDTYRGLGLELGVSILVCLS
jgi:hypothetical protein